MLINSLRLGPMEIPDINVIIMERPVLGFEHLTEFCLIEKEEMHPFLFFQSCEDPAVTFMVINPRLIRPDYKIEINSKEIAELRVAKVESVETYVIVTVPEDPAQVSVNLQGPILINTENNLAKQLVLVNSDYQVCHYLLDQPKARPQAARRQLVSA